MWPKWLFGSANREHRPLYLYNTLTKSKEEFTAPPRGPVRMYNCGPTVYDTSHIGNLRSYVFADLVRRALEDNGFEVKQIINITDFGHLSSDADSGNDKMTMALKREGLKPTLEKMLEEKGYAYRGKDGLYFDTSAFPTYGSLGNIDIEGLKEGARVASAEDKRNPTDFLLWKSDPKIGWDSPWGKGFPGWHIECSAMINATLGKQIDIHTGGIEHIPVHHNNEIAQSEAAIGKKPFSRFWMHHEFLNIDKEKISKSLGNMINLAELSEKGFHPLALRYLFLGAHYRTPMNFTWEALEAAQTSFLKLRSLVDSEKQTGTIPKTWRAKMHERFNDDLDTPGALGIVWEMVKDRDLAPADIRAGILDADRVLGLGFDKPDSVAEALCKKTFGVPVELDALPERVRTLVEAREAARKEKDWTHADSLRSELQKMNYMVEDTSSGPRLFKRD